MDLLACFCVVGAVLICALLALAKFANWRRLRQIDRERAETDKRFWNDENVD
jgi:hypothetical protein